MRHKNEFHEFNFLPVELQRLILIWALATDQATSPSIETKKTIKLFNQYNKRTRALIEKRWAAEQKMKEEKITPQKPSAGNSITQSCKLFHEWLQPKRLTAVLAKLVVSGDEDNVKRFLMQFHEKYPQLLIQQLEEIKDLSGRVFKQISVWEYTLWALDVRYMAPLMLDILPRHHQEEVCLRLGELLEAVRSRGVTYELNGKTIIESHYDFGIVKAYHDYNTQLATQSKKEQEEAWPQIVGEAQRLFPAHVMQHYCHDDAFWKGAMNSQKLKRSLEFRDFSSAVGIVEDGERMTKVEIKSCYSDDLGRIFVIYNDFGTLYALPPNFFNNDDNPQFARENTYFANQFEALKEQRHKDLKALEKRLLQKPDLEPDLETDLDCFRIFSFSNF